MMISEQLKVWFQYVSTLLSPLFNDQRKTSSALLQSLLLLCLGAVPWFYGQSFINLAPSSTTPSAHSLSSSEPTTATVKKQRSSSSHRRSNAVSLLQMLRWWKDERLRSTYRHFCTLLSHAAPTLSSIRTFGTSRQGVIFSLLSLCLVLRTLLSIQIATATGAIIRSVVEGNRGLFFRKCLHFALVTTIASVVNTLLRWSAETSRFTLRYHLVKHFHRHYFAPEVFYRVVTQTSSSPSSTSASPSLSIETAASRTSTSRDTGSSSSVGTSDRLDQRIVRDVPEWSRQTITTYISLVKPILDVVLFSWKLRSASAQVHAQHGSSKTGALATLLLAVYFTTVSVVIQRLSPDFGARTAFQLAKDNLLTATWARLQRDRLSISLLEGESFEKKQLDEAFYESNAQAISNGRALAWYRLLESVFVRYGSIVVGYGAVAALLGTSATAVTSAVVGGGKSSSIGARAAAYGAVVALLTSLLRSMGQLVLGYRALNTLRGLTERVYDVERLLSSTERTVRHEQKAKAEEEERQTVAEYERLRQQKREEELRLLQQGTPSSSVARGPSSLFDTPKSADGAATAPTASGDKTLPTTSVSSASFFSCVSEDLPTPNAAKIAATPTTTAAVERGTSGPSPLMESPLVQSSEESGPIAPVTTIADFISFDRVPIVTPNGKVLCQSLTFTVRPAMNVLVTGPNGCGKSSTFRVLAGLWPHRSGVLKRPIQKDLFYIPQRPYMVPSGSIRDQLIYPAKAKQFRAGESDLFKVLQTVGLETLFDRPGVTWDSVLVGPEAHTTSDKESKLVGQGSDYDSFSEGECESRVIVQTDARGRKRRVHVTTTSVSVGERQRLALARLLLHRPKYAILDECTSHVDAVFERQFYLRCQELGITVLSIAHRPSVWEYHNWLLTFDGVGGVSFAPRQSRKQ